jgi:hypothetical protein
MCFGSSDLRGAAPTGLDKPARVASITSRDEKEQKAAIPNAKSQSKPWEVKMKPKKMGEKDKGDGEDEYGESYEFLPFLLSHQGVKSAI